MGMSHKRTRNLVSRIRLRDGDNCWLCGLVVRKNAHGLERHTLDHVLPKSLGGDNKVENLKLAHKGCNEARGNRPACFLLLNKENTA